jgi:hypothetical protein
VVASVVVPCTVRLLVAVIDPPVKVLIVAVPMLAIVAIRLVIVPVTALSTFDTNEPVDVAFWVVKLVAIRLVVVAFVAERLPDVRLVVVALVAVRLVKRPVTDCINCEIIVFAVIAPAVVVPTSVIFVNPSITVVVATPLMREVIVLVLLANTTVLVRELEAVLLALDALQTGVPEALIVSTCPGWPASNLLLPNASPTISEPFASGNVGN